MKGKIGGELKIFKADLHVHTPASSDFERKTHNIEEEYFAILKMAKRNKIHILGITDHGSIDGYLRFLKMKEELDNELLATVLPKEMKSIERKIGLFENVLIVPGIELKTRYGPHYVILFDPEKPVNSIRSFLDSLDSNLKDDALTIQGTELTKRAKRFGCINIAAHVDSNGGIYNISKNSSPMRKILFKDPNLDGMHFVSQVCGDEIKSLFQDPYYRRQDTLAFIKCSDFHNRPGEEVGKKAAYFKLDKPSFLELVEAFQNPIERVSSPGKFDINRILQTLLSKKNRLCIEILDKSTKTQFLQYASAYSNSDGGYILVGISNKENIKGIEKENISSVRKCLLNFLTKELDPVLLPFPDVIEYEWEQKIVLTIFFPRYDNSIVLLKSGHNAYELKQNEPVAASSAAIMNIVIQKVRSECLIHLEHNRNLVEKLTSDIRGIEDSLTIYPIFNKILRDGPSLRYLVRETSVVPPSELTMGFKKKTSLYMNGNPTGATIILDNTKPRQKDIILRYSAPAYRGKNISGTKKENSFEKGCIVLYGGATHLLNHSVKKIIPTVEAGELAIIVEVSSSLQKHFPVEYIVAFLKSSPFLWYAWEKYGEFNLVKGERFLDLRIPLVNKETQLRIVSLVQDVCRNEKNYLKEFNKIEKELPKRIGEKQKEELIGKRSNLILSCNSEIDKTSLEIDNLFYEELNINEEEQKIIQDTLGRQDLYVAGSSTKKQ